MAPELLTSLEADELRELASKIRDYQTRRDLSDAQMCKKFPDLGSTKTWSKIRVGDWDELSLENQLANYRLVWANIEALGDRQSAKETLYEGIWATVKLAKSFGDIMTEQDVSRCIFLLGPSGSGKSSAITHLVNKYGSRLLVIRATTVWNDSPVAMLRAILAGLGVKDAPSASDACLALVHQKLRETRRGVIVEDAHHLGPRLLNLVINMIDETPGEWILAAIDKLWSKMALAAYEECRQLNGNRLADRIVIGPQVRVSDAEKMLAHRVRWSDEKDLVKRAAEHIAGKAAGHGLLAFVREAIKRLNDKLREKGGPAAATWEAWIQAVDEEVRSR